jgi:hypothetical protein
MSNPIGSCSTTATVSRFCFAGDGSEDIEDLCLAKSSYTHKMNDLAYKT